MSNLVVIWTTKSRARTTLEYKYFRLVWHTGGFVNYMGLKRVDPVVILRPLTHPHRQIHPTHSKSSQINSVLSDHHDYITQPTLQSSVASTNLFSTLTDNSNTITTLELSVDRGTPRVPTCHLTPASVQLHCHTNKTWRQYSWSARTEPCSLHGSRDQ